MTLRSKAKKVLAMAHFIYPSSYQASFENLDSQSIEDNKVSIKPQAFRTHTSAHAQRLHRASEFILLPARWCAQLLARVIEPNPGANKRKIVRGFAIRSMSLIGSLLLAPFAIISLAIGFPLRMIDHFFRPAFSFFGGKKSQSGNKIPAMTEQQPLHIRTHNLGFVPSTMAIVGDLRDTAERAKELSKRIIEDTQAPDVIFFQESFHEDATRILCKELQKKYPYIIHSVAPQISGFSSGALVASKYPILKADFERFQHMIGPERLSPRGIFRIRFTTQQGDLLIYSVHTQALLGQERAQARLKQLTRAHEMMQEDLKKEPGVHQVLVGDLNTSYLTAWGENNLKPAGQAEEPVLKFVAKSFEDPFLQDHHPKTGQRIDGTARFLLADQMSLRQPELKEPSGTWYHGPFAKRGVLLNTKLRHDREKHKQPEPKVKIEVSEKPSWGTIGWHVNQTANTARFDYTLFPKNSTLAGRSEIRNIGGNRESASSDHLPCDLLFWSKNPRPALLIENDKAAPQQKI